MAKHEKPTKEELQRQIAESAAKLEELEKNPPVPSKAVPSPSQPAPTPSPSQPVASPSHSESAPSPSPSAPEPSEEEKEKLRKKLSASARENQKIYAKNRKLDQALDEADQIPDPTEEELQVEYEDWDEMSTTEKRLAKENFVNKLFRQKLAKGREESRKIEKWTEKVDEFIKDPKTLNANPDLEGKQEDFKAYAAEESNNSVPFKVLVAAFLHEQSLKKVKNKGQMFEKGGAGRPSNGKQPDGKLTAAQGAALRNTDYNKWKQMLRAGKISDQ